ncbi:MAG: hypothetical protein KDD61_03770 [Bdellovibrionales bacterium]|nr:hypothetical protein [Bdellovibrionales bacterium]
MKLQGLVKALAVLVCSFALGWTLYRCTHDDVMSREDYSAEEQKLQEREKLKEAERATDEQKAIEEGYKPVK